MSQMSHEFCKESQFNFLKLWNVLYFINVRSYYAVGLYNLVNLYAFEDL